jgi:hypothetical protein
MGLPVNVIFSSLRKAWSSASAVRDTLFVILVQVASLGIFLWWLPWNHLPFPGFAVGIIGLLGAVMSVQPPLRGFQKAVWIVLIAMFLVTELRAIRKDRDDSNAQALKDRKEQDEKFQGIRESENRQFSATADRLTEAIGKIEKVLETANTTLSQTAPHADIRFTKIGFTDQLPPRFASNTDYSFNYYYANNGNAPARKIKQLAKLYMAKADDRAAQEELVRDFESSWDGVKVDTSGLNLIPGDTNFGTIHRTFSNQEFSIDGGTLYYLLRFEYSDNTGRWRSDTCELLQRSSAGRTIDIKVTHQCLVFQHSRYEVGGAKAKH